MRNKRRNTRATPITPIEDEIAYLRGLDLKGLRARWLGVFQRQAPAHLGRHLLFSIIAYRIQADRYDDLDHETKRVLVRTDAKDSGSAITARLVNLDQKRTELSPGTVCQLVGLADLHLPEGLHAKRGTRNAIAAAAIRTIPRLFIITGLPAVAPNLHPVPATASASLRTRPRKLHWSPPARSLQPLRPRPG